MATYTKIPFSTRATGVPINLGSTLTTIHSTLTSATVQDEIWLYVGNNDTLAVTVEINITDGTNTMLQARDIPSAANSGDAYFRLVIPGFVFSGTGSAATQVQLAETSASGLAFVSGFVNRITP